MSDNVFGSGVAGGSLGGPGIGPGPLLRGKGPPTNIGGIGGIGGINSDSLSGSVVATSGGAMRVGVSPESSPGISGYGSGSGGTRYAVGGSSSAGRTVPDFPGGKTAATWLPHAQRYIAPCPSVKTLVPEGMEIFLPVQ